LQFGGYLKPELNRDKRFFTRRMILREQQSYVRTVAADARFLINTLIGEGATAPITLIQNWNPEAVQ